MLSAACYAERRISIHRRIKMPGRAGRNCQDSLPHGRLEFPVSNILHTNFREPLFETVWKIQMSPILGAQESAKRREKRPNRRITLPKTRDLNPSSDFPNSL